MRSAEFYSAEHEGTPYGKDHSGQDYKGWRSGTLIPSFIKGTVYRKGYDRRYGFWVALQIAAREFVTWSHLLAECPLDLGSAVEVDDYIALLGSTGSLSKGPHTHVGYGTSPLPWSRPTLDPLPLIAGARAIASQINSTPTPEEEDEEMGAIRYLHKKADSISAAEYGIFGVDPALPNGFKVSADVKDGETWGRVYGRPNGAPWIQDLTRDQWIAQQKTFAKLAAEQRPQQ
jgi:hypothetical protein